MSCALIIPARIGSSRLPLKILAEARGKPLLWWTWQRACAVSRRARVIIAVDDTLVKRVMEAYGAEVWLTSPRCRSGSVRVAAVARQLKDDIVVNVQADEPRFSLVGVRRLIRLLARDRSIAMATLACPITSEREVRDPHTVKVVTDGRGDALYFSRSVIPFIRDAAQRAAGLRKRVWLKHIGIYAFRRQFLLRVPGLPRPALEEYEKLEQLAVLHQGTRIRVVAGPYDSPGIDTARELRAFRRISLTRTVTAS